MAPRSRNEEDPGMRDIYISNVPNRGLGKKSMWCILYIIPYLVLGYYDCDGKLVMVSDVSLQLLGPAFSASFGLKGHCGAICYHNVTSGPKLWRVVPKHVEKVRFMGQI